MLASDFTISLINPTQDNTYSYIPLTTYSGGISSTFTTFKEQLTLKENGQASLSFDIAKYRGQEINPFFAFIVNNRKLRLEMYNTPAIDFIITSITPNFSDDNLIYNVSCQDVMSYELSKQAVDISMETKSPKNIREMVSDWLLLCRMSNKWLIDPNLETQLLPTFPSEDDRSVKMTASIELTNTSAYNGLVEIALLFGANLSVTYNDNKSGGTLFFTNIKKEKFKGYTLNSRVNAQNLSISSNTENFCSVLHVRGSEDSSGAYVGVADIPPYPVQDSFLGASFVYYLPQYSEERLKSILQATQYRRIFYTMDETTIYGFPPLPVEPGLPPSPYGGHYYGSWIHKTKKECNNEIQTSPKYTDEDKAKTNTYFTKTLINNPSAGNYLYCFDLFKNNRIVNDTVIDRLEEYFNSLLYRYNMATIALTNTLVSNKTQLSSLLSAESDYIAAYAAEQDTLGNVKFDDSFNYAELFNAIDKQVNAEYVDKNDDGIWEYSQETFGELVDNGKMEAINNLVNNVWSNDKTKYFTLITELYGTEYFTKEISKFQEKIDSFSSTVTSNNKEIDNMIALLNIQDKVYFIDVEYTEKLTDEELKSAEKEITVLNKNGDYVTFVPIVTTNNTITFGPTKTYPKKELADIYYDKGDLDSASRFSQLVAKNQECRTALNYYTTYKACYEMIIEDGSEEGNHSLWDISKYGKSLNLEGRLKILNEDVQTIWEEIYSKYGDFIVESTFEDSAQLSRTGLLTAALKTFATYQIETVSYSTSVINYDLLVHEYVSGPIVGDKIILYDEELNQLDHTKYCILLKERPRKENMEISFTYDGVTYSKEVKIINVKENSLGYEVKIEYKEDDIYGYSTADGQPIMSIYPATEMSKVELTITEIDRELRGGSTKLTVSDNKTIDNLIDRLLYSVRK